MAVLFGTSGNDTLRGTAGNDYLYGNRGDDLLDSTVRYDLNPGVDYSYGGDGNDRIRNREGGAYGGNGNDTLEVSSRTDSYGNDGNDNFFIYDDGNPSFPVIMDGGNGIDTISFNHTATIFDIARGVATFAYPTPVEIRFINFENYDGAFFNDYFIGSEIGETIRSYSGNDTIYAGGGDDTIDAGILSDTIYGGTGNDILYGGNDNPKSYNNGDFIDGGTGNDIIYGQSGSDNLYGGLGSDRFVYLSTQDSIIGTVPGQFWSQSGNMDRIHDYNRSEGDLIDLSAIDANTLWYLYGNQQFRFVGDDFTGSAGELIAFNSYIVGRNGTFVMTDTNGDREADMTIFLVGYHGVMSATDFVL